MSDEVSHAETLMWEWLEHVGDEILEVFSVISIRLGLAMLVPENIEFLFHDAFVVEPNLS